MGITLVVNYAQEFIDQYLRNQPEPKFDSRDELRVARALCRSRFSQSTCTPNQTPYSNGILTSFQKMLPALESAPSRFFSNDWLAFRWEGQAYRLLCNNDTCYTYQSRPRSVSLNIPPPFGCSSENHQFDPCSSVDCGIHGTCFEDSTNFYCVCDDGYKNVDDTCVLDEDNDAIGGETSPPQFKKCSNGKDVPFGEDEDLDGLKNEADACPCEPGPLANKGCSPFTDDYCKGVIGQPPFFIEIASLKSGNIQIENDGSLGDITTNPFIGADGRFVGFISSAPDFSGRQFGGDGHYFLHDRATGITEQIDVGPRGAIGDGSGGNIFDQSGDMSSDGRYIAFDSGSSNLIEGGTNGTINQIFVRDRETGDNILISANNSGEAGDFTSSHPRITPDGRYVAFESGAKNLVLGDPNGAEWDVFVRDMINGGIELISKNGNGTSSSPAISSDGRFVAYNSFATNLVPLENVENGLDIFLYDRENGTTEPISVNYNGQFGNNSSAVPSISGNGRYVAFNSWSKDLVPEDSGIETQIFVRDRQLGLTSIVSRNIHGDAANDLSFMGELSKDGRFVAFSSAASNLVDGDTNGRWDIFVHDQRTRITRRVSVGVNGVESERDSKVPRISGNGKFVVFESDANNLVPNDLNNFSDIFIVGMDHFFCGQDL